VEGLTHPAAARERAPPRWHPGGARLAVESYLRARALNVHASARAAVGARASADATLARRAAAARRSAARALRRVRLAR
jgi:hypothetical protein